MRADLLGTGRRKFHRSGADQAVAAAADQRPQDQMSIFIWIKTHRCTGPLKAVSGLSTFDVFVNVRAGNRSGHAVKRALPVREEL